MAELQQKDIEVISASRVAITLPKPKLLGAEGETVYSSQSNVYNCVLEKEDCTAACVGIGLQEKNEIRNQAEIEARRQAQDAAIKQGILDRASEEAKRIVEGNVKRLNFTEVTFK